MCKYLDEFGLIVGYCNSCGEETRADFECCDDGEVWHYDDCSCEECEG